jgi:DNA-binding HxlR family transcriptional regulator
MIGERWTVLVIRELASGPKRYIDVLDGVPGMNTTLLAKRLRDLETDGIVRRRRLPPPAASTVYELTDAGVELAYAFVPLVRWGARHALGPREDDELFHVHWPLLVVQGTIEPETIEGLRATYEFHVDGSVAHMTFDDGRVTVHNGPSESPADVTLTADAEAFVGVGVGRLDAAAMIAAGRLSIEGAPPDVARFADVMGALGTGTRTRARR